MSALENETTVETTTFEHFDREWAIPTQRHLSHIKRLRDEGRRGWASGDLVLVETFLGEKQFDDLLVIDPTEVELAEFANEIATRLGFGSSGNSSSS